MRGLKASLGFLTVLPVRVDNDHLRKAPAFFPIVGLLIGMFLSVADLALGSVLPRLTTAFLLVILLTLLTGMMHLDGLADTADALGGYTREDRLRIMKDHALGAFGGAALVLVLLGKVVLIAELSGSVRLPALLFFPAFSRWVMAALLAREKYVSKGGLAQVFAEQGKNGALSMGLIGLMILMIPFLGPSALFPALLAIASTALLGELFRKGFGGITGDTLGTANELSELLFILIFALLK